jgi:hypothetical protein
MSCTYVESNKETSREPSIRKHLNDLVDLVRSIEIRINDKSRARSFGILSERQTVSSDDVFRIGLTKRVKRARNHTRMNLSEGGLLLNDRFAIRGISMRILRHCRSHLVQLTRDFAVLPIFRKFSMNHPNRSKTA